MRCELDRWWSKVNKVEGRCWEWAGAKYRLGYGHFRRKIDGKWKMYKAHRYSYEMFNGEIPDGLLVLHSCDNTSCVNPDHLITGTHKENSQDMIVKGRFGYPRNATHKQLSYPFAKAVREARKNLPDWTQAKLAYAFKISTSQCSRILKNQIWSSPEEL